MSQRSHALDELDHALVRIRRVLQLPAYRQRLLAALGIDLPLGTLRVIRAVQRTGDDAPSIGDVADLLAIDPSTASRAVDDAVSRGYLERRACDRDRRRQRLRLTAKGTGLLAQASDVRRELLGEVTATWDAAELDALVDRLDRLADGFERLSDGFGRSQAGR